MIKESNIKKYLKLGVLLFGVSILLWNCEKEDVFDSSSSNQKQEKSSIKRSTLSDKQIIENTNIQKAFKVVDKNHLKSKSKISNQLFNFTINKNSASVISTEKYDSYTFTVKRKNAVKNTLENFVFTQFKRGKKAMHLIRYPIDKNGIINQSKATIYTIKKNTYLKGGVDCRDEYVYNPYAYLVLVSCTGKLQHFLAEECPLDGNDAPSSYYKGAYEIYTVCTDTNDPDGGDGMGGGGDGGKDQVITEPKQVKECPPGKAYNVVTGICECIGDNMVEASNGDCVKKPCKTSKEDLKKVFPNTDDAKLTEIANAINKYGKDFGIDTKEKMQHFLAQAGHESTNYAGKEFTAFEENLNYRWNKLGIKDFKKYFNPVTNPTINPNKANPNNYKRSASSVYVNSEKLANLVYGGRNGNNTTGDGYKYRGRGIIQLTGKYNYQQFTTFYKKNYSSTTSFVTNPDLLASNKEIAVISALWFFKNNVLDKIKVNNTTTVEKVTKIVNGKQKGIKHRKEIYVKTKININCT